MRIGEDEEPDSLNLMYAHSAASDAIVGLLFSFILRYDAQGNYIPDLATQVPTLRNGGISRDGKRIIVHLRKGVVWADGAPLTAADWLFTYNAVRNPLNVVKTTYGWDDIASASAPDPYTIVIALKRPNVAVLGILAIGGAAYPPMPAHLLAKGGSLRQASFNESPLSSGPFVLERWNHGDSLTFVPNRRYFRGAPHLKEVVWKVVPDVNTLFNDFVTHEIDVYPTVNVNDIARLQSISGITVKRRTIANWRHLGLNLGRPQTGRRASTPRNCRGNRLEAHRGDGVSRGRLTRGLGYLPRALGRAHATVVPLRSTPMRSACSRQPDGNRTPAALSIKARSR